MILAEIKLAFLYIAVLAPPIALVIFWEQIKDYFSERINRNENN